MLKTVLNMLVGALVAASVATALAVTGQVPQPGFAAIDGNWLLGLSGGTNYGYQYGITARAGGTQAACTQLTPGNYLYQVDTVVSSGDSVCVPFAVAGTVMNIRNAGAQPMNIFGQAGINQLTNATDTISGGAASSGYSVTANQSAECFAAKNGAWSCIRGN